jgi:hypothetical protein
VHADLEVACDESGYEGEKLVGGTTDVFAHAAVRLDIATADECIRELRDRIRSPATQYKANHVLREKHRPTLLWLIGPDGPLRGNARVQLVEKAYQLLGGLVGVLVEHGVRTEHQDPGTTPVSAIVTTLYDEGPAALGPEPWNAFLHAANDLLRVRERVDAPPPADAFFDLLATLRPAGPVGEILDLLRGARGYAEDYRADPPAIPPLDPLIPALHRAVNHWGRGGRAVAIVHDRQNTLSADRVAALTTLIAREQRVVGGSATLASIEFVEAALDARIQLADFLAGVARKLASDQLHGQDDPELTALMRPYVDPLSVWGDPRLEPLRTAAPTSASASGA